MRAPDPALLRRLSGWLVALGAVALLALVVPGTSSAFTAAITNSADTAASKTTFTCADGFAADARRSRAYFEFPLTEASGAATAADASDARNPGAYEGSNTKDADSPTACPNDVGRPYLLDGSTSRITTSRQFSGMTGDLSETIWFKTVKPGKLMGFESSVGGTSSSYDKHLYVDTDGYLVFGVYPGGTRILRTPSKVMDGAWHFAAATLSTSAGTALYLDGKLAASDASTTAAEDNTGYWRIGEGRIVGWDKAPDSTWFTGSLRFAAAYPFVLSAREIAAAASIGAPGGASAQPTASPTPTSTATSTSTPTPTPTPTASSGTSTRATPGIGAGTDEPVDQGTS